MDNWPKGMTHESLAAVRELTHFSHSHNLLEDFSSATEVFHITFSQSSSEE